MGRERLEECRSIASREGSASPYRRVHKSRPGDGCARLGGANRLVEM